ncbi:MAG: hypothetical protein IPJ77_01815 [Planctomycetes bacterium]|nr:hypothetical protein [Planctomycetota bacterium]
MVPSIVRALVPLVLALPLAAQCPVWRGLASNYTPGIGPLTLAVHDSGAGPELFVGGVFTAFEGTPAIGCARFDGVQWHAATVPFGGAAWALEELDLGSGPVLWCAGYGLQRWNGTGWVFDLNSPTSDTMRALAVYDAGSGKELYAGFATCVPPSTCSSGNLYRRSNGVWSPVGTQLLSGAFEALAVYDDGSGPALYAAGKELRIGGVLAGEVVRWDGTSVTALPAQPGFDVHALTVFDDGSGPALVAGGRTSASLTNGIVSAWRGGAWTQLGPELVSAAGSLGRVSDLVVFDDLVHGPSLFASGVFAGAGIGDALNGVARWDGVSWRRVGGGVTGNDVLALAVWPHAGAPSELCILGDFTAAGGVPAARVAAWAGCDEAGSGFCAGDGVDPQVLATCPCANVGAQGHGCANSVNASGARLDASGRPEFDDVLLHAQGMPATAPCLFFKASGVVGGGFQAGDGIFCLGGALIRLGLQSTSGGSSSYPVAGQPSVSQRGGNVVGSGQLAYYQAFYRNAAAAYCPPETINVTNGYVIAW